MSLRNDSIRTRSSSERVERMSREGGRAVTGIGGETRGRFGWRWSWWMWSSAWETEIFRLEPILWVTFQTAQVQGCVAAEERVVLEKLRI